MDNGGCWRWGGGVLAGVDKGGAAAVWEQE